MEKINSVSVENDPSFQEMKRRLECVEKTRREEEENINDLRKIINRQATLLIDLNRSLTYRNQSEEELRNQVLLLQNELNSIYVSKAWWLITKLRKVRYWLIPKDSVQEKFLKPIFKFIKSLLRGKNKLGQNFSTQPPLKEKANFPEKIWISPVESTKKDIHTHTSSIDIIVCVHNAFEDVRRCLDSIKKHTSKPYRIIIVNDGSDIETSMFLREFSIKEQNVLLLENEKAKGYTRAANQGLMSSTGDFVILLNSDTIVSEGWLDQMVEAFHKDSRIGLVGPLSNTASWQSIPEILDNGDWSHNYLPDGYTVEEMARLISQNYPAYPEVPLLNGFCFMIRREVLADIGYLDEASFPQGYGEEDDYVLRARENGWKLVWADNVYVYHAQSKSFSDERRKLLSSRGGEILRKKHDGDLITRSCVFCMEDHTLAGIRARAKFVLERDMWIQKGKKDFSGKRVLFVLPVGLPGGGANVVFDEATSMVNMGVDVRIFNMDFNRETFITSYPNLKLPVTFGSLDNLSSLAPLYDAVIATVYFTVEWLSKIPDLMIKGYYVQGFEPLIYKPGVKEYMIALDSYNLIPNIICFSKTEWTRDEVLANTGKECEIVGISVNTDLFRPRQRSLPVSIEAIKISAMIRPSTPYREPELTMKVLKRIAENYGNKVEIHLFGVEPDDSEFLKLEADFNWKCYGVLSQRQVATLFNNMDIFLDFSSHQAMGLTALEAMASGCTVIVPFNGGSKEFVIDHKNGLVVDTSSFDHCVNSLISLIEDPSLLKVLQANAIIDAASYYPEKPAYKILKTLFKQRE